METFLEMAADICLDIAVAALLLNVIRGGERQMPGARLTAAVFAVGFVLGTVSSGLRGINLYIVPDVLGFVLSYTAFVFTFPRKKSEVGNR